MSERAIDVFERYQGNIDWAQVAGAGGIRHALIKLTNGAAVASPAGDHYVAGAKAAGLRVGGYAYALGGDPVAEANVFADELLRLNALDDAPALDYEDASVPQSTTAQGWIAAFLAQLQARIPWLTRVLLYSSGSMLTRIGAGAIRVPGLTVMIWDAEYAANDGIEHPTRYYTGPVAVHQYTSAGHVPGIAVSVDLDTVNADITEDDVFTPDDFNHFMWGNVFDDDGKGHQQNFAGYIKGLGNQLAAANASLVGLTAAVAGLSQNPALTPDAVKKIVDDAVAQHIQITGEVHIGPAPAPTA